MPLPTSSDAPPAGGPVLRRLRGVRLLRWLLPVLLLTAIWKRSQDTSDSVSWTGRQHYWQVRSTHGELLVYYDHVISPVGASGFAYHHDDWNTPASVEVSNLFVLSVAPNDTFIHGRRAGLEWIRWASAQSGVSMNRLVVPFWLVAALAYIPTGLLWGWRRLARARRRRRVRSGLCGECGYDLRGSAARCPECGAGVETPDPASSDRRLPAATGTLHSVSDTGG